MAAARQSVLSSSTTTTYPSTLSSSMLGLTDSPLAQKANMAASRPRQVHYQPSTPPRSRPTAVSTPLRESPSAASLASPRRHMGELVSKRSQELLKTSQPVSPSPRSPRASSRTAPSSPARTTEPKTSQDFVRKDPSTTRPASRLAASTRVEQWADDQARRGTPPSRDSRSHDDATPTRATVRTPGAQAFKRATPPMGAARPPTTRTSAIAIPRQPSPVTAEQKSAAPRARTRPPSPSKTEDTMASDWDAELANGAQRLRISQHAKAVELQREREAQRRKDVEWERMGMWDAQRDAAREAEERTRRDAGRAIAYPPSAPRVPVRAAPTGVTSVHVGIRPRLHPSRLEDSLRLNQPDSQVPAPLFSPEAAPIALEDDRLERAKAEYQAWLDRKDEREGGIGEDGYGTRDWVPRGREVAKPGRVEGIAHSDGYRGGRGRGEGGPSSDDSAVQTPMEGWYPYPAQGYGSSLPEGGDGMAAVAGTGMMGDGQGMEAGMYDPSQWQGYWDPMWWWSMGYGLPQQPALEAGEQQTSAESDQAPKDKQTKVHFAASPDKSKKQPTKQPSKSSVPVGEDGQALEVPTTQAQPYDMSMMYNPYQAWGAMNGMAGYNPYMANGTSNVGSGAVGPQSAMSGGSAGESEYKPYDSGKMKQGRMGHYGYLEGRELAGPPVGYLPAGMRPEHVQPSASGMTMAGGGGASQVSPPGPPATAMGRSSAYGGSMMSGGGGGGGSQGRSSAWGDSSLGPRARYDGASTASRYVQADADTPYPRAGDGGMTSAFTRWGTDQEVVGGPGIDGRYGIGHRRMREGRV